MFLSIQNEVGKESKSRRINIIQNVHRQILHMESGFYNKAILVGITKASNIIKLNQTHNFVFSGSVYI